MSLPVIIALIAALAALITALLPIIKDLYRYIRDKQKSRRGIIPPIKEPRRPRRWIWLRYLIIAILVVFIVYLGIYMFNGKPFDNPSTPSATFPSLTDTPPSPTNTPVIPTATQTPLPLSITSPKEGDSVGYQNDVKGAGAQAALVQGTYLNIIVITISDGPPTYHVQSIPFIKNDGTWLSSPVIIGSDGTASIGKTFQICALLSSQRWNPGEIPRPPADPQICISVKRK